MKSFRSRWLSTRTLLYAGAAFPFFWMISTSFKPPAEVFAQPPAFIPDDPTWDNFRRLFTATSFLIYFKNSLIVSGLAVVRTGDAVLVLPLERAQEVRRIVERLEGAGRVELL